MSTVGKKSTSSVGEVRKAQEEEEEEDILDVNNMSTADLQATNKRLIEFIYDLKEAIESGHFASASSSPSAAANEKDNNVCSISSLTRTTTTTTTTTATVAPSTVFSNLLNVDNLSNQTFTYIVSWLKQHQKAQTPLSSSSNQPVDCKTKSIEASLENDSNKVFVNLC